MIIDPFSAAIAGVGFGLDMFGKQSQIDSANRASRGAYNAAKSEALQKYALSAQAAQKANAYRLKIWNTKLDAYKKNLEYIDQASDLTYAQLDRQSFDVLRSQMFQLQKLEKDLLKSEGQLAARNMTDKSAKRFSAVSNAGQAGQAKATVLANTIGEQSAIALEARRQALRFDQARMNAYAPVAVAPEMEQVQPFSFPRYQRPEQPNQLLSIGDSLFGAVKTYASLAPPNVKASGGGTDWGQQMSTDTTGLSGPSFNSSTMFGSKANFPNMSFYQNPVDFNALNGIQF